MNAPAPEPDTKARILAAAEAEFLARGYDRSRMQSIADKAGINKAMLHYHFRSKDALFAHIFQEKTRELFPRAEANLRVHTDFIEFIGSFVDLYIGYLILNPFLPSYLLQVSTNHPELLAQIPNAFPRKFVAAFEAAVRAGTVRPHDSRQFIVSLIGMCVLPFVGKNLLGHMLELDEDAFQAFLNARAAEIKRYVELLLRPAPSAPGERSHG